MVRAARVGFLMYAAVPSLRHGASGIIVWASQGLGNSASRTVGA